MQVSDFAGNPLFQLNDRIRLSQCLGESPRQLRRLACSLNNYVNLERYTGHKLRPVEAPRTRISAVQSIIADALRRVSWPDYLHSGRRGRSHVTNAAAHRGGASLCQVDLRSYYWQITTARVQRFFMDDLQCAPEEARLLTRLCTNDGRAPAGSRVSGPLAFHVTRPLFDELQALSMAHRVVFTVFVDDLCFSGKEATRGFLWSVKKIIHRHAFSYHHATCSPSGRPRTVTGVLLIGDRMMVSPSETRRITEELAVLKTADTDDQRLRTLVGRLAAAASIDRRYLGLLRPLQQRLRRMKSWSERGSRELPPRNPCSKTS